AQDSGFRTALADQETTFKPSEIEQVDFEHGAPDFPHVSEHTTFEIEQAPQEVSEQRAPIDEVSMEPSTKFVTGKEEAATDIEGTDAPTEGTVEHEDTVISDAPAVFGEPVERPATPVLDRTVEKFPTPVDGNPADQTSTQAVEKPVEESPA